ncbi:MAG: hypothetical protein LBQ03_02320 [Puniceicoccales bacterium]|jgi:hypothetical protein|nr:hypothetical protein [Puniceicoccales bacterium]
MGVRNLSKLWVGIYGYASIQVCAVSSSEYEKSQDDPHRNVPFGKKVARKIRMTKPNRLPSINVIHPKDSPTAQNSKKILRKEKVSKLARTEGKNNANATPLTIATSIHSGEDSTVVPGIGKQEAFTIPVGYKLQNVPGDGLCGYWATLTAKKAKEADDGASIQVEKKEIFELLGRLSDRIAHMIKKEDKTDAEIERVNELEQLIRDGYAEDYENLYKKIEKGQMQLDSPLALFLADEIGYNIILEWEGIKKGKRIRLREMYRADNADGVIMIYYSGNGSGGHYQAIIPSTMSVIFIRDLKNLFCEIYEK